jgi:hypothetical protein
VDANLSSRDASNFFLDQRLPFRASTLLSKPLKNQTGPGPCSIPARRLFNQPRASSFGPAGYTLPSDPREAKVFVPHVF